MRDKEKRMKDLFLMRHAEAEAGLSDWQRCLTERGREQAVQQGQRWLEAGLEVDGILCSSAPRALETAQLLMATTGMRVDLHAQEQIYHASATQLWELLQQSAWQSILLVGHLPAVLELAAKLLNEKSCPLSFLPATLLRMKFLEDAADGVEMEECWEI